jgi:hypothetical protein
MLATISAPPSAGQSTAWSLQHRHANIKRDRTKVKRRIARIS